MVSRDKAIGKKLYPVCSFEKNQHKLETAYNMAWNALYDDEDNGSKNYDKLHKRVEDIEKALTAFSAHVKNGTVYATWENSNLIKDIIAAYDVRHDRLGDWKAY